MAARYAFTPYFELVVLQRRAYLRKHWCVEVLLNPIRSETQWNGRIRFWGVVAERPGYYLRVITLEDGATIHNAFFDRRFRP